MHSLTVQVSQNVKNHNDMEFVRICTYGMFDESSNAITNDNTTGYYYTLK